MPLHPSYTFLLFFIHLIMFALLLMIPTLMGLVAAAPPAASLVARDRAICPGCPDTFVAPNNVTYGGGEEVPHEGSSTFCE